MLDAATGKLVTRMALAGHPESCQLEHEGSRILFNVPGAHQIAVLDRLTGTVVSTWGLDGQRANFPMALE